jgi:hypothetical protein
MHTPNSPGEDAVELRRALRGAVGPGLLSLQDLWLAYVGVGGNAGSFEIEAFIQGAYGLPALERALLATALTELMQH